MSGSSVEPEYVVHAIRYAHDARRRLSENFLPPLTEPVDLHESPMPMDFFVWVVQGGGRTILVDSGFDHKEAAKRGRVITYPVAEGLQALGIQPDRIDDVILTHLHWDHAGNHDICPQARYHVQDREMAFCTGRCMCHGFVRRPYSLVDVTAMLRRVYDGNVQFHDNVGHVAPGVSVHLTGGHSAGLQVVRVKTANGWLVLASDASHYYANLEQSRPFPLLTDTVEMFKGFDIIRSLGSSPRHWIPGHDPQVLTLFPPSIAGNPNIVRVDVAPAT
jgi:glyoxylase-like metal-dependent hydrolase (beta-lactamase superfamily II)